MTNKEIKVEVSVGDCDTKECDGCAECSWVIKYRRQLLKY